MAYAGIDIGTSGCKISVFDLDGNILFKANRCYIETGMAGRRELDPNIVSENVLELLSEAGHNCPTQIDALSIASLGESVICLDKNGKVLFPAMLTGDCRGVYETQALIQKFGAQTIMNITGLTPNELYTLPKLIWMKNNFASFDQIEKIFFFEDYISYLLTGKRMVSYSSACRSMAFDIRKKNWSTELLAFAGISSKQLSQPVEAGEIIGNITFQMAEKLHLNPALILVAGGHDQSCAALGSGMYNSKSCETSMGTCEFMLFMLPVLQTSRYMIDNDFSCIPYVLANTYLTSLEVTTCGILKNWGRQVLFSQMNQQCLENDKNFFDVLEKRIQGLQTEVMALPQFGSAGNPDLCMDARGTLCGLTIHTKPEEIYLAFIEGMAFQLYLAFERLKKLGICPERMIATGGGAASDTALQIRANVFGISVSRLTINETGTLGSMLLAATGTGAYTSLEEGIRRTVHIQREFLPDSQAHTYYQEKFQKYKLLYELMHDFK